LERGYALVLDAQGGLVRSTNQIAPGDKVTTRLSDGAFISRVESAAHNRRTRK
jgi:exonuclease VII large subunit